MPYPIFITPEPKFSSIVPPASGVDSFDTAEALEINRARMESLHSLQLPLKGKRVIDVGCGVGHLAQFFVQQQCEILCLDARKENIERLRFLYPHLEARVFDLETDTFSGLDIFDVVFAFGVLYHLENPFRALRNLAAISKELLLLETVVSDHHLPVVLMSEETYAYNQALRNIGSRPSPSFVVLALRAAGFKHIYAPKNPPNHPDFKFTWNDDLSDLRDGHLLRCVFISSRVPLDNSSLVSLLD